MKQSRKFYRILHFIVILVPLISFQELYSQLKEVVESENDYILSKYPYSKTKKFEKIYCDMYSDYFNCENIEVSPRGIFPDDFTLADKFFIKLSIRPINFENYNALNIAGLYLRMKRPAKNDTTYEYTFLDIELESLIDRAYFFNTENLSVDEDEIKFRLALLSLIEENLFIITDKIYDQELTACDNFEGPYYDASRRFFTDVLFRLWDVEKNREVRREIRRLLSTVPDEYRR